MADKVGNLAIIISGDAKQFTEVMAGVEQHLAAAQARMNAKANKGADLGGMFGMGKDALTNAAGAIGIGLTGKAIWDAGQKALGAAKDFEVSEAQLKSLTGSAAAASNVMAELRKFAGGTPFDVTEIAGATRKLMGSGMGQQQAIKATKELAAAAAATGGEISSLARAYSHVTSNGRFMTEELNQFADADFPIQEFAKTYGKTMAEMRKDMEHGAVPVEVMAKTFERLTGMSGKFSTALADMMKTSAGLAKQEEARHAMQMAEIGEQLKLAGFGSGQSLTNRFEESMSSNLALIGHGFDILTSGQNIFNSENWTDRMNPESSSKGIAERQKAFDEANLARREKWATGEGDLELAAMNARIEAVRAARELNLELEQLDEVVKGSAQSIKQLWAKGGVRQMMENAADALFPKQGANPFRNDFPEANGFRRAMAENDLGTAAAAVQSMRQSLASKERIQLPSAASFGSSAAAESMNAAIAATMGAPLKSTEEVLKEMKKVEEKAQQDIESIKNDLRNLKVAKF